MSTMAKFKIQTRNQNNNLHTAWTTDGIGDQNEFELAAAVASGEYSKAARRV